MPTGRQTSDLEANCDALGPMAAPDSLQELAQSHIEVLAKGKGGNTKFKCNHCEPLNFCLFKHITGV